MPHGSIVLMVQGIPQAITWETIVHRHVNSVAVDLPDGFMEEL